MAVHLVPLGYKCCWYFFFLDMEIDEIKMCHFSIRMNSLFSNIKFGPYIRNSNLIPTPAATFWEAGRCCLFVDW